MTEPEKKGFMVIRTKGLRTEEDIKKIRDMIAPGIPEYLHWAIYPSEIIEAVEIYNTVPVSVLDDLEGMIKSLQDQVDALRFGLVGDESGMLTSRIRSEEE